MSLPHLAEAPSDQDDGQASPELSINRAMGASPVLVAGVLMFVVPLVRLLYGGSMCSVGGCTIASPWTLGWLVLGTAGLTLLFLGATTILVALTLRFAGRSGIPFLGGVLIALFIVYLSFLTVDTVFYFHSDALRFAGSVVVLSIGPLLAFRSGLILLKTERVDSVD